MKNSKRYGLICFVALLAMFTGSAKTVLAHCQVPCGIYDDSARFVTLAEHITTIEKAMNQINTLSGDSASANAAHNANQITRWVLNKEKHAEEFSEILGYYFLAQRIKAPQDGQDSGSYLLKLELVHQMIVAAMKCKQSIDLGQVEVLRSALQEFSQAYFKH